MRLKNTIILMGLLVAFTSISAQDVTTVEATSGDISENLDLEAVASVFGESKDLEDFEKRLNDPEKQISNLDLNGNGEVDYLRVVEASEGDTRVVIVQAVLGKDQYQDVAVIDVERNSKGETQVQVVGDVYIYGSNYIIEPVYVAPPPITVWFWGPLYRPWHSPYYWGYYPPYYRPWRPYPCHYYRSRVHVHINVRHTYHTTNVRRSTRSASIHYDNRRNDYGRQHPDRSFDRRNNGVNNRAALPANNQQVNRTRNQAVPSTGRPVQNDWKPQSQRSSNQNNNNNRVQAPVQNPGTRPATSPPQNNQRQQNVQRPQNSQNEQNVQRQQNKQKRQQNIAQPQNNSRPASTPAARPHTVPGPNSAPAQRR